MSILVCNHLDGEESTGCFAKIVFFLVSCDCCVALPCGAIGLSAVCDCGISLSYSLTIFIWLFSCYGDHCIGPKPPHMVDFSYLTFLQGYVVGYD